MTKNLRTFKGVAAPTFKSDYTSKEHRNELRKLTAFLEYHPHQFPNRVEWSKIVDKMQKRIEVLEASLLYVSSKLEDQDLKDFTKGSLEDVFQLGDVPKPDNNVALKGKYLSSMKFTTIRERTCLNCTHLRSQHREQDLLCPIINEHNKVLGYVLAQAFRNS